MSCVKYLIFDRVYVEDYCISGVIIVSYLISDKFNWYDGIRGVIFASCINKQLFSSS